MRRLPPFARDRPRGAGDRGRPGAFAQALGLCSRAQEKAKKGRQGMLDRIDPTKWRSSTKIEALVEELTRLRSEDHTIKSA